MFAYKSGTSYPPYVIVIVFVVPSHCTSQPRFSVTNLKGSIVLEFIISGTTFILLESIGTLTPLTSAMFFPIQSIMILLSRFIVTFFAIAFHSTTPPSASIIGLIGTSVLLFLMIGGESNVLETSFTVNLVLPI